MSFASEQISDRSLSSFYDPAGIIPDKVELFNEVAKSHEQGIVMSYGLGRLGLKGHGITVADAVHYETELDPLVSNLYKPRELQELTARLHRHADYAAEKIVRTAAVIEADHLRGHLPPRLITRLRPMLATFALASLSHQGQFRRNLGEDGKPKPFFTHPQSVDDIVRVTFNNVSDGPEQTNKRTLRILAIAHDSPEDEFDAAGAYLEHTVPATPLVYRKVLQKYGYPDAALVADRLRLLAHTKGITDKSPYNDVYIPTLLHYGKEEAAYVKRADTHTNLELDGESPTGKNDIQLRKLQNRQNRYRKSINATDAYMLQRLEAGAISHEYYGAYKSIASVTNEQLAETPNIIPALPYQEVQLVA